jgi:hypothetical protein
MRRRLLTSFIIALPLASIAQQAPKAVFAPLSREMQAGLTKQRAFVSALIASRFPGEKLAGARKDLLLLQRVIDAKAIPKTSTWELQAVGVIFGDVLVATVPGLAWWQVTDEYGTDPTVRYRETTVQINALTTLSKRVEGGEPVDVEQLAERISEFIRTQSHQYR